MGAHGFDELTKGLATGVSRRSMLKTLGVIFGATAAAGAVLSGSPREAEAVGQCGNTCPNGRVCCKPKGGGGGWACRHPGQCA